MIICLWRKGRTSSILCKVKQVGDPEWLSRNFTHTLLKHYEASQRSNMKCTKCKNRFWVWGKLCKVKQVGDPT